MDIGLSGAPGAPALNAERAAASRRNGAKSRGPKTPEGKARSSGNALKHGLRAQKHMLLPGESAAEYQRLEAALLEELAPEGALQAVLARRVVAAWRLERVERIETEVFAWNQLGGGGRSPGLALIRDCNKGARAFDTLLRYRGTTLAEFWRALRTLKALQAEQAAQVRQVAREPAAPAEPAPKPSAAAPAAAPAPPLLVQPEQPIEPESRANPDGIVPPRAASEPVAVSADAAPVAAATGSPRTNPHGHAPGRRKDAPSAPIEPDAGGSSGEMPAARGCDVGRCPPHRGVATHAATQPRPTHAAVMRPSRAVQASPPTKGAEPRAGAGGRT